MVTTNIEIRALIADDQEPVRSGMRAIVGGTEIEIVSEATTGSEAIDAVKNHEIDIAILDIRMPGGDGLYALGRIKESHPDLPCLMLSTYDNAVYVERSRVLGASGYIAKGSPRERLLESIRLAAAGHSLWFDGK